MHEIEQLKKRFGFMAVKKGFITVEQLIEAMKIQVREEIKDGKHRIIGTILVEMGIMNTSQVNEVLESIEKGRAKKTLP
ncbi:MAG: hypothetical protein JRJ65_13020 [Deltaproteobacteria bacterium]|nr:hypothetical protein [Deltaproteobacteria bacterium]